jgi:hypothetical protein
MQLFPSFIFLLDILAPDINPLKTEFLPNNISNSSSYLTGNTLRLQYQA